MECIDKCDAKDKRTNARLAALNIKQIPAWMNNPEVEERKVPWEKKT